MHGYIAPSGLWCGSGSVLPQAEPARETESIAALRAADPRYRIYPNPTTGLFTLELPAGDNREAITVRIFGMMGESVLEAKMAGGSSHRIDLSGKPCGLYFVTIINGSETAVVKVIRQ